MVGRRGEAPLVPPDILPNFKKTLALATCHRFSVTEYLWAQPAFRGGLFGNYERR